MRHQYSNCTFTSCWCIAQAREAAKIKEEQEAAAAAAAAEAAIPPLVTAMVGWGEGRYGCAQADQVLLAQVKLTQQIIALIKRILQTLIEQLQRVVGAVFLPTEVRFD